MKWQLIFRLVICSLVAISHFAHAGLTTQIHFKLHGENGEIAIMSIPNEDPLSWGFRILSEKTVPLSGVNGFPVCTAKISYEGRGYKAAMGWIQFITYSQSGEKSPIVMLDRPPQLGDSNAPYSFWGIKPVLFDAPAMLGEDHMPKPNVDWRADSFLVSSPDGVMTKTVIPIASFSWGYSISADKKITIRAPEDTHLKDWSHFRKLLSKQFPGWVFQ
jgi:hypothetical protein